MFNYENIFKNKTFRFQQILNALLAQVQRYAGHDMEIEGII